MKIKKKLKFEAFIEEREKKKKTLQPTVHALYIQNFKTLLTCNLPHIQNVKELFN